MIDSSSLSLVFIDDDQLAAARALQLQNDQSPLASYKRKRFSIVVVVALILILISLADSTFLYFVKIFSLRLRENHRCILRIQKKLQNFKTKSSETFRKTYHSFVSVDSAVSVYHASSQLVSISFVLLKIS